MRQRVPNLLREINKLKEEIAWMKNCSDVVMERLKASQKENAELKKKIESKLIPELGRMMECNTKLAEAAAKIISPQVY